MYALKALAGLSLLLAFAPAIPQTLIAVPVDRVARARFPRDEGKMIDALASINSLVNHAIEYEDDDKHYGMGELWVMFPKDGKGDCEDYALSKLGILSNNGFPIATNAKITMVMVRKSTGRFGHAILEVKLPSGAIMELDSRFQEPMTREMLKASGYEFPDW